MKKHLLIIGLMITIILLAIIPVYAQNESIDAKAKVIKVNNVEEISKENEPTKKVQNVTVRILEGEYENEEYEMSYVIQENIQDSISCIELKEESTLLVNIEEKDGEITNVIYKEHIEQNYILYVIESVLVIALIIIGIKKGMMPIIIYIITLLIVSFALIFSMKMGWNLILVSSMLSLIITTYYIIKANGLNAKSLEIILGAVISISFAGILISILFDAMELKNINVKITENFVNIKDLISSCIIVVSCGFCNLIILIKLNMDSFINRKYKTKSDNIIEGQRTLKI